MFLPFLFNPLRADPFDVARHDYMEFFIVSILELRSDLQIKTSVVFLVKWLDIPMSIVREILVPFYVILKTYKNITFVNFIGIKR